MSRSPLDLPSFPLSSRLSAWPLRSRRRSPWVLPAGLLVGALVSVACSDGYDDDDADGHASMGVDDDAATSAMDDDAPSTPFDNVAACDAFVDGLVCGDIDLSGTYPCSVYADVPCNIADYFDCLRDEFRCVEAVPDPGDILSCADLATCA